MIRVIRSAMEPAPGGLATRGHRFNPQPERTFWREPTAQHVQGLARINAAEHRRPPFGEQSRLRQVELSSGSWGF